MSNDLNRVLITGNIGSDPELNYTPQGTPFLRLSLANHRPLREADGSYRTETQWFKVLLWQRLAENGVTYLRQGSRLLVEGYLQSRAYTDREGIRRVATELVARDFYLLGNGKTGTAMPISEAEPSEATEQLFEELPDIF